MLKLPAKIHPLAQKFGTQTELIAGVLKNQNSAVHILFPQVFKENIKAIQNVAKDFDLPLEIFYPHKVNQSVGLVNEARATGIGIDVASKEELQNATIAGFVGNKIIATGPKNREFLCLAIEQKAIISVDSMDELVQITDIVKEQQLQIPQPVLIRFSGFKLLHTKSTQPSKFGFPVEMAPEVFRYLQANKTLLNFLGVAFHLDTTETNDRVAAVDACLQIIADSYHFELKPTIIDIGGGLRQTFIDDVDAWHSYVNALKESLLQTEQTLSWPGVSFGYTINNLGVHGTPVFNKYSNTISAATQLHNFLTAVLPSQPGRCVYQGLLDFGITTYIEPGKSLLDHVGITMDTVIATKPLATGNTLATLNLIRDNLVPMQEELMLDPNIIYTHEQGTYTKGEYGVYFAGSLCLERDMLYFHKTFVNKIPKVGDVVIFPNTGAYQMDLSASTALLKPKPEKIIAYEQNGQFNIVSDAQYVI